MTETAADRKQRARAWFESLRDRLCATFEAIEEGIHGRPACRAAAGQVRPHPDDAGATTTAAKPAAA
ncbi:MAG: hypothetical protein WDN08_12910 [Rhizomicrobium sp.]